MAVTFPCTNCKKVLRSAAAPPAGKKVKCPACGGLFMPMFKDPEETEATAVSTKPSAKPAMAKSKPEAAPAKRRDDDNEESEELPRKKKRPVADMDEDDDDRPRRKRRDDEDEDDYDAPKSRKGRRDDDDEDDDRSRKGKKKSGMGLILALAGGGVGLLLIFGLTAFVWPGFLLSGGGGGGGGAVGGIDPLSLVPKDANLVAIVHTKKLGNNKLMDEFRKKAAAQGGGNNEDAQIAELMLQTERLVIGGSSSSKMFNAILVFAAPANAESIKQKLKVGPAINVNGQTFFRQAGDPVNGGVVGFPTDRFVCVANGFSDQDFATLMAGKGNRSNLAPELQTLLNGQTSGDINFAVTLDNQMRNAIPAGKGAAAMPVPGLEDLGPVMQKAKGVGGTFAMQGGAMNINVSLACDNPADATKAKNAFDGLKVMIPLLGGLMGAGGKGGPQINNILNDVGKMQFTAQGNNCNVAIAFSPAAVNEMEAAANQAGKMQPGGGFGPPPGGGFGPGDGFGPPPGGGFVPPPFPKKKR